MQTLFTKEQFLRFRNAFKARAKAGSNDSADMLLYNIVRGLDTKRGFTAISNTRKLNAGQAPWYGYDHAKNCVIARLYTPWRKIWDPTYLKNAYGLELSEDQLKAIAQAAGWRL